MLFPSPCYGPRCKRSGAEATAVTRHQKRASPLRIQRQLQLGNFAITEPAHHGRRTHTCGQSTHNHVLLQILSDSKICITVIQQSPWTVPSFANQPF